MPLYLFYGSDTNDRLEKFFAFVPWFGTIEYFHMKNVCVIFLSSRAGDESCLAMIFLRLKSCYFTH